MNLGMVNAIYKIASIFISFITIIIIFKLIAECKITKGIWLALAICIVICIVACIMLGIYEAEMSEMLSAKLRKINEADLFLWLYLYDVDVDMTKLNIISDVLIINRCILVILSTWNVVNQLLKKDFLKSEAETETESSN
ncbi:MAG: hypothetical protein K2G45_12785 [Lachnospiraceae bacterium]|nr:hypothetical protein [Lachnospiraceae bacterium]